MCTYVDELNGRSLNALQFIGIGPFTAHQFFHVEQFTNLGKMIAGGDNTHAKGIFQLTGSMNGVTIYKMMWQSFVNWRGHLIWSASLKIWKYTILSEK